MSKQTLTTIGFILATLGGSPSIAAAMDRSIYLGDGSGLGLWFQALGHNLVMELARNNRPSQAWHETIDLEKLRQSLNAEITVLDQNETSAFTNGFGEVKDGKVVFLDSVAGPQPKILLNRYVWTRFYRANNPDFRLVLHLYLYAAGYNDRHYEYSSLVSDNDFPRKSPDDPQTNHRAELDELFNSSAIPGLIRKNNRVIVRAENPTSIFKQGNHPVNIQTNSIEQYDDSGEVDWIYFPNKLPLIVDSETMEYWYASLQVTALLSSADGGIIAAGILNVWQRFGYGFALKLDQTGKVTWIRALVEQSVRAEPNLWVHADAAFGDPIRITESGEGIVVFSERCQAIIHNVADGPIISAIGGKSNACRAE